MKPATQPLTRSQRIFWVAVFLPFIVLGTHLPVCSLADEYRHSPRKHVQKRLEQINPLAARLAHEQEGARIDTSQEPKVRHTRTLGGINTPRGTYVRVVKLEYEKIALLQT